MGSLFCVYRLARRFQYTHKSIVYILVENIKTISSVVPEGAGGGGQGIRTPPPPPPENSQNIGFLSNTGLDSLKITKLPSQHSMLGHHRHASDPLIVVFV